MFRTRAPRPLETIVAVILAFEALILGFSTLNGVAELALSLDHKARLASAFEASGVVWAILFVSGIKVIDGSAHFFRHARQRRTVIVGVPAMHVVTAIVSLWSSIDTDDVYWAPLLLLPLMALSAARVLLPHWSHPLESL